MHLSQFFVKQRAILDALYLTVCWYQNFKYIPMCLLKARLDRKEEPRLSSLIVIEASVLSACAWQGLSLLGQSY